MDNSIRKTKLLPLGLSDKPSFSKKVRKYKSLYLVIVSSSRRHRRSTGRPSAVNATGRRVFDLL